MARAYSGNWRIRHIFYQSECLPRWSGGRRWVYAGPRIAHSLSGNDYWSGHLGIDIAAGEGASVYAADSGVVTMAQSGYNYGYGNVIQIDHGNGYSTRLLPI